MRFWRLPLDAENHSIPRGRVYIIDNRCKGCGFCIEFCPNSCLKESKRYNQKGYHPPELVFQAEDCRDCGLCSLICPEFAIFTELKEATKITEEDIRRGTTRFSRKDQRIVKRRT
ncbi:ferredoxin family protein [Thermodesulfobacteriota bacterium]